MIKTAQDIPVSLERSVKPLQYVLTNYERSERLTKTFGKGTTFKIAQGVFFLKEGGKLL